MSVFSGITVSVLPPDLGASLGTITEALQVNGDHPYDRIGGGSIVVPVNATNVSLIDYDRVIYAYTGSSVYGNPMEITTFIISKINYQVTKSGTVIKVEGPNLLHELTRRLIGNDLIATQQNNTLGSTANTDDTVLTVFAFAFEEGRTIYITLDDASTHTTTITNVNPLANQITIADPMPSQASSGNAIMSYIPDASAVDAIMAYAPSDWNPPSVSGFNGALLQGANEKVFEALLQAQAQGGGHFRLKVAPAPVRTLEWLNTPDTSGVTHLVMPDENEHADMYDSTRGIIHSLDKDPETLPPQVTRVFARGAGGLIFTAAQPYVTVPAGYTVSWASGVIIASDSETGGAPRVEKRVDFENIQPIGDTDAETVSAAIDLYLAAFEWLSARQNVVFETYTVTCTVHQQVKPYSTVNVVYSEPGLNVNKSLIVHEVRYAMEKKGELVTRLKLGSLGFWQQTDEDDFTMGRVAKLETAVRHLGSTSFNSGSSGVPTHSHSGYLLADGTVALSGNMDVNTGIKIDGVDISAHAADANAHHDAVTKGSGGLTSKLGLSGQELTLANIDHADISNISADDHHDPVTIGAGGLSSKLGLSGFGQQLTLADIDHSEISNITANQHHNQVHNIIGSDHTVSGDEMDVIGLTATNDLGIITPSSDPGANEELLKSTGTGGLILQNLQVEGAIDVVNSGNLTVGTNVLFVNNSGQRVGINTSPDAQFALDINGNVRWTGWGVGKMALQIDGATMICHYDGPRPYNSDYSGTALGHMGQVADWVGGIIFREGKFGSKALQTAEATTNLVTNPSFETNTSDWASAWGDTLSRVLAPIAAYGQYSLEIKQAGSSNCGARYDVAVTASTAYTVSLYLYVPSDWDGGTPSLRLYDGASYTTLIDSISSTKTDEWERLVLTDIQTTSSTLRIVAFAGGSASTGKVFYVDAVQAEQKAYVTPYCDGSLDVVHPDGDENNHTWSGTAHASTSSRVRSFVKYDATDIIKAEIGTFMCWVHSDTASGTPASAGQCGIFRWWDASGTESMYLRLNANRNAFSFLSYSGSSITLNLVGGVTYAADEWHHVAVTWEADEVKIYVDGILENTDTNWTVPTIGSKDLYVGVNLAPSQHFNGKLDEVVFLDRVASADEIRAIFESDAPVFAESSTFSWTIPNQLVWADENGLFMRDSLGNAAFGLVGVDGHSWGGQTLNSGDLMLGNTSGANFFFDISEGRINIRGGTSVESYIDTDGTIVAAGGDLILGDEGIRFHNSTNIVGDKILWYAGAGVTEVASVGGHKTSSDHYVEVQSTKPSGNDALGRFGTQQVFMEVVEPNNNLDRFYWKFNGIARHTMEERRLGINTDGLQDGTLHARQENTGGTIPVLVLEQKDLDQPFITFQNGTVYTVGGVGMSLKDEYLKIKVGSNTRYLRLYG